MPSLILLMIAGAAAAAFWNAARAAAERAEALGRDACAAAGVQWLDQSVHANGVRVYRRQDGWLGLERSFRFDYSYDGADRHSGRLVLRAGRLVSFTGPSAGARIIPLERRD
ncbi:hypothetical protein B1992_09400 [Pseudoxanthomonas broegbernensis]|uniref:DUF3301 domain-containing protein n=1 Tax=Pseudoxanthomonas broegbernensis TaxID=83619 RepID=A0A7V8GLX5_9GAMM|nr:DUF3301 domain-containing protein [Pseudoxanthomonas broegbernensis]KAF1686143.1 hypothetical protein B1992_09400 [Pseudoxanthomonas broegbernensis]MBB6063844.1 hypothetical protein [Pseudoxanthomonas broegbernensis]